MIDRRAFLGAAACGVMGLGLSGCSQVEGGDAGSSDDVPPSWVTCRIGKPSAIDPLLVSDRFGLQVLHALFCPLTRIVDGVATPAAAHSVTVSDDARTFTFSLVEGATFHNGESVTASCFKRAWERLVKPMSDDTDEDRTHKENGGEGPRSRWGSLLSVVDGYDALSGGRASELVGLRCPDDLTLTVSLTEPQAAFASIVSHPALGPVPASAEDNPVMFSEQPMGNGPFMLDRPWKRKGDIRLTRFDGCAYGASLVDGVLLAIHDDTVAAYNHFQAGVLDICDVPVDQLKDAEDARGISSSVGTMKPGERFVQGPEAGLTYMVCNTRVAPFDNAAFRRAISCGIDREALCKKVLNYSAAPAMSPVAPCVGEAVSWEACAFDADRALELIEGLSAQEREDEAQQTMGSAEESKDAPEMTAEPLNLDFTLTYREGGVQGRIADQIASDMSDLGLTVKTAALATEDLAESLDKGDYACCLVTFDPTADTIDTVVSQLLGTTSERGSWAGYEDDALTAALTTMAEERDATERTERAREALVLASEAMPMIPLVHPAYAKVASDRVQMANVLPNGLVDLGSVELV